MNQEDQSTSYTVSLRNETLQLLDMFTNEYGSKELSDMLHGAWITLEIPTPDYLAQVAHSMREFIEKAHDNIVEAPVKTDGTGLKTAIIELTTKWSAATKKTKSIDINDWSGTIDSPFQKLLKSLGDFFSTFSAQHKPRGAQQKAVLAVLDGSGQPIPEAIAKERLKLWGEIDDYFKSVAHHQKIATKDDLAAKITVLENFILDIKYPERAIPITTLAELDSIIAEGNAA